MDLETRKINNILKPYCVSLFDGETTKSFFLTDYSSSEDMLKDSILYLMKSKYDKYKLYLHNFYNFNRIFLLLKSNYIKVFNIPITTPSTFNVIN